MNKKIKDIVVSVLFLIIIIGFFVINILKKDEKVSVSERRKMMQFPKITADSVLNGKFSDDLEEYAMDQFILRDKFRSLKTFVKLDILHQKDNNGLFEIGGSIYKNLYPLNERSVLNFTSKINNIYEKYLENMNVFYTIVPDKNYFLDDNLGYLKLDYNKLISLTKDNINGNMKYIDILDTLNEDKYYKTDTHWKQECLTQTVNKIAQEMKFYNEEHNNFNENEYGEFYGVYYGQLGKNVEPDTIKYLTNDTINNAVTYNYETNKESAIYDKAKADASMDKYDLFLSGSTPIIEIRNKEASTDKELIIFRDSFGSSIAPLFTQAYKKITLIDTRYISSDLISNYVSFSNQDVLFLYSTLIINESGILK